MRATRSAGVSSHGTGEYAPIPPVFGPRSPSAARLKSCAAARGTARVPSQIAKSETSRPSSSSSTTTGPPSAVAPSSPASTSSAVRQTNTPLPAARPSALITHGGRATGNVAAVATPAASSTSLAKLLEPSIRAAGAPGPKTAIPACRSSSATPATRGASGPMTARSTDSVTASPSRPSRSSARTGWQSPSRAIPGLPGAAWSSASVGLCASRHASACSRAPEPTRSTRTRRVYCGVSCFPRTGHHGVVQEPGLDRHEWESEWSDLEERLRDDPGDALFELDELIARMLEARGVPLRELDGQTETEPETVRGFAEARRITELVGAGEDVDPGDIAHAVNSYRELYAVLLERGPAQRRRRALVSDEPAFACGADG